MWELVCMQAWVQEQGQEWVLVRMPALGRKGKQGSEVLKELGWRLLVV